MWITARVYSSQSDITQYANGLVREFKPDIRLSSGQSARGIYWLNQWKSEVLNAWTIAVVCALGCIHGTGPCTQHSYRQSPSLLLLHLSLVDRQICVLLPFKSYLAGWHGAQDPLLSEWGEAESPWCLQSTLCWHTPPPCPIPATCFCFFLEEGGKGGRTSPVEKQLIHLLNHQYRPKKN